MRTSHCARPALLIGASVLAFALAETASAQPQSSEGATVDEVVVTGSRVITSGANSPTPLTVVTTDQLQATTPTNIADGLNKLPVFVASQQPRRAGDGSGNLASNILNLRGFGAQRTLVLFDGRRATPSNADGTVDVDSLPQMLMSRVEVVTGGASAVYGSDAVTGVVNFVLDKGFEGFKFDVNGGVSDYGDGAGYKIGAAFGRDLFDGRGHFVASAERQHRDPVNNFDRPYGPGVYVLTGSGTQANPFVATANTRRGDSSFGGVVGNCTAPCPALGQQFIGNGVLGPFNPGVKTGTGNQNVGGDGAYSPYSTALAQFLTQQIFSRFSYELTNNVQFYLQGYYADSTSSGWHFPAKLTPGTTQASNFFKNNPFLTPAVQAQLGNNGLSDSSNMFGLGTYIISPGQKGFTGTNNNNRTYNITTGLDGTLGEYKWEVFYSHGSNKLRVENRNNSNYQRQFAALDAVVAPDGSIRCYAATQAATAGNYANCVPLNAFGPTAITPEAYRWFTQTTQFEMENTLDDFGASISGRVFDNWAGPVRVALSGEVRYNKYSVESTASPTDKVDCTGLRICNPNLPLWAQPVLGNVRASNHVWEIAAEAQVPLLSNLPLVESLELNVAGRHTDYSTSGAVNTWKLGFDYDVNGELRFRGTTSVDIRAPTLNDMFSPVASQVTGFVDIHTSTSNTVFLTTRGNPDLKPEEARTYTLGVVWKPSFLDGFTASVDWYKIRMKNAIGQISANNTAVQQLCEASGGASQYCSLFVRPLPFSNTTPANFPTQVFALNLNTALTQVEGVDVEASYKFDLSDVVTSWGGGVVLRFLANYQPTNESQAFPGAPVIRGVVANGTTVAAPKTHITAMLSYTLDDWAVVVQDNWSSGYSQLTQDNQVWANPNVPSFNTVDVNIERKFAARGMDMSAYLTIQNLFDSRAPLAPWAGSIGIIYPVPANYDIMGRYFSVGVRGKL